MTITTNPGDKPFDRGVFQGMVLQKLAQLERSVKSNNSDVKDVVATVNTLVTEVTVIKATIPRKRLVNLSAIGLALTLASGVAWGLFQLGVRLLGN